MASEVLRQIVLFGGTALGLSLITLGLKLLFGNKSEYDRNRIRTKTLRTAIKGEISVTYEHGRDHRVASGFAINRRKKTFQSQGKLSEEAIDGVTSQL